jgi:hypothetical protein
MISLKLFLQHMLWLEFSRIQSGIPHSPHHHSPAGADSSISGDDTEWQDHEARPEPKSCD